MAEEERILEVTPDFDGKRIDQCLAASFSDCSRSFLQKLLKDGKVSINGKTQKASSKVAAGDAVLVLLPEPEELNVEPENIPLDILYEDDDLLVVNKPKGMVVHPAAGHSSGTLVQWQITIDRIIQANKCCLNVGCNFFYQIGRAHV